MYLWVICDLMIVCGVIVLFFIFDGLWCVILWVGSMIEDDILVIGNFGLKVKENFGMM